MMQDIPTFIPAIILVSSLALLPFMVVMATSYTKIVIVLMLLRNALGVQQAPSGLVINALALSLTVFILVPVGHRVSAELEEIDLAVMNWQATTTVYDVVLRAFSDYLIKFVADREMEFFMDAALQIWPKDLHQYIHSENIYLLLPAHVVSEITRAFQIGFLVFLPFLVVDMVVSNILLSMGAMMVPPALISLPIKILLFVATDGWSRLLHGLIISYV